MKAKASKAKMNKKGKMKHSDEKEDRAMIKKMVKKGCVK